MIGTALTARSSWHTTRPSRSGNPRSSSTRSTGAAASASAPRRRQHDLEPLTPQTIGQRLGDRGVVLDQQQAHTATFAHHGGRRWIAYRTFALVWPRVGAPVRTVAFMKSLTSRTTLITAVAVAGVLIAGTAAVAANIGILNASNDSSIGSLSATDDLLPSTTLDPGAPMVVERHSRPRRRPPRPWPATRRTSSTTPAPCR